MMFSTRAALVTAVAALALVTSGCSSSSETAGEAKEKSIVLITPTAIGSNNFLQLAKTGAEAAGKANNADVKVYESKDPASVQQNIDAAVRAKADIVIGVSFSVQDQFDTSAQDSPDQQFLLVDACPEKPAENLTCASFKEYESNYLAGVEAGLLTKADKVGAVASVDTPFVNRWVTPFLDGAKSVNKDVKSSVQYVGGDNPFGDQARAKAQAQVVADSGADYLNAAASGGNYGIFEAAEANKVKAFGVDTNQCLDSPGNVVDNSIKRVDVALENSVKDILAGKSGDVKVYGLAENGVGLTGLEEGVADSKCLIADHPDVIEKVKQVRDDIIAGKITVKDPVTAG
ncbi:BMP family ABC transporter substrate-binding protein [Saxibacter everestensis]|uniref:BMP family ABC transporter substrate-binding protein n=1 Tax=Saxibacter everestensis TaxID=2909229 RepID=A0ABY8QUA5_9MICO|nr:BMP family ABC transporter substrate-binding protein [Brevibacteriaceae bacterium ZFBP1038]